MDMIKFKWYYVFMLFLPFLMVACDKNDDDEIIEYDDDIWDVVEQIPELSTLETAIQAAGLANTLDNDQATLTLFAPVNNAFAALPAGELDELLKDPTGALKDILLYHVVDGAYSPGMLKDGLTLKTLNGASFSITKKDGAIKVNGAKVSEPIYVINGVVYLIDAVLTPPAAD